MAIGGALIVLVQVPYGYVESVAFDGYRVAFGAVSVFPGMARNISYVDVS